MKGRVSEVFHSIQGEGLYVGEKQVFVRFFGCNLNCSYCDTKLKGFSEYEARQLFDEIELYADDCHSVSFTGGEPLLQRDFLREVLGLVASSGRKSYLETNGTLFHELKGVIDMVDIVAMDLKLPTSTGMGDLWWMHRKFLDIASRKEVFLKAVVCQATVEDDLGEAIKLIKESEKPVKLVLQPNSYEYSGEMTDKLLRLKNACKSAGVDTCVIPQVHKKLGIR